ncbi:hypothetical protein F383_21980 [Gossypium arboreum]|uniref:Uncharacterized protein n=1 Tax=Gossypium arboreum TaxID=29729 RepID=A0A0B0MPS2_GOSAR|nr:hypothetical protein F383_21980 [Gossypium arboreum]
MQPGYKGMCPLHSWKILKFYEKFSKYLI